MDGSFTDGCSASCSAVWIKLPWWRSPVDSVCAKKSRGLGSGVSKHHENGFSGINSSISKVFLSLNLSKYLSTAPLVLILWEAWWNVPDLILRAGPNAASGSVANTALSNSSMVCTAFLYM